MRNLHRTFLVFTGWHEAGPARRALLAVCVAGLANIATPAHAFGGLSNFAGFKPEEVLGQVMRAVRNVGDAGGGADSSQPTRHDGHPHPTANNGFGGFDGFDGSGGSRRHRGALAGTSGGGDVSGATTSMPATGTVEVAFSPRAGAEALVVKVIDSAPDLQILAYSFTSQPITAAILRAKKRGVRNIRVLVDQESNLGSARPSPKSIAALNALSNAGIEVRTISVYAIHHDKIVIAGDTVQGGSFNYSDAAQTRNSENVIVNWHNPQLAKAYRAHFERNWAQGKTYGPAY